MTNTNGGRARAAALGVTAWARTPDLTGPAGRAWRWQFTDNDRARPEFGTSVAQFLIHQPGSHPWWTWYVLSLVHLRDTPGIPHAVKHFPAAAYEVMVIAMNPEQPVPEPAGVPGVDGRPGLPFLTPIDQCHQIGALPGGDEKARELLDVVAMAVVNGHLICDQDHRTQWAGALIATVQHLREGVH